MLSPFKELSHRPQWADQLDPAELKNQAAYALHYGSACSPMVTVVPDINWPGMYRLAWPDGRLSDMANLSRAKDAAVAICERASPGKDRSRFHWKNRPAENARRGLPVRLNGGRGAS
jgi:hypothetical protein